MFRHPPWVSSALFDFTHILREKIKDFCQFQQARMHRAQYVVSSKPSEIPNCNICMIPSLTYKFTFMK